MKGCARAFGAVSIVNAIATGQGAALGIDLATEAEVELDEGLHHDQITVCGVEGEDTRLAVEAVKEVLSKYHTQGFDVKVKTQSEIPIGKGLKSSSVASNAIVLATLAALNRRADDLTVISWGVEASLRAGVSITGAFDDACASYFGGIVVTDNLRRKIVRMESAPEELRVLILVPEQRMYTKDVDRSKVGEIAPTIREAFRLACAGNYWRAMYMNGMAYSAALQLPTEPAVDAMRVGAVAAGLSGTGPSVAAICFEDRVEDIVSAWSKYEGELIRTKVNNRRAGVVG